MYGTAFSSLDICFHFVFFCCVLEISRLTPTCSQWILEDLLLCSYICSSRLSADFRGPDGKSLEALTRTFAFTHTAPVERVPRISGVQCMPEGSAILEKGIYKFCRINVQNKNTSSANSETQVYKKPKKWDPLCILYVCVCVHSHVFPSSLPAPTEWLGSFQPTASGCDVSLSSWKEQSLFATRELGAPGCRSGWVPSENTWKDGDGETGWREDLKRRHGCVCVGGVWHSRDRMKKRRWFPLTGCGERWIAEGFSDAAKASSSSPCLYTPLSLLSHSLIHTVCTMETTYTYAP